MQNDIKRVVVGWASVAIRYDGVEHYRWKTSDGEIHECHSHISNRLPNYHFGLVTDFSQTPRYDISLRAS